MFPNARLVIVAIFSSIVAVSCGLGVFAAFRINHQPFTRAQSADPPLQLVSGSGAPAPVKDVAAAPFGVRFLLNAPVAVPEAAAIVPLERTSATEPDAAVVAPESAPAAGAVDAAADAASAAGADPPAEPAAAPEIKSNPGGAGEIVLSSSADRTSPLMPAEADGAAAPEVARPAAAKTQEALNRKAAAKAVANRTRRDAPRRVVRIWRVRGTQPPVATQSPPQNFAPAPVYRAVPDASGRLAPVPPGMQPAVRRRVVAKPHRSPGKAIARVGAVNPTVTADPAQATGGR